MARPVPEVEFRPGEAGEVLDAMASITRAAGRMDQSASGVDSDDAPPRPTGLTAILAPRTPGALMGTWVPPSADPPGPAGCHGRPVAPCGALRRPPAGLARRTRPRKDGSSAGQPAPRSHRGGGGRHARSRGARLDHRRGHGACGLELSGEWRADIYLPKPAA